MPVKVGIIGGSGFYHLGILQSPQKIEIETPFRNTPVEVIVGKIGKINVAFLPRHGYYHTIPPHKINYRANIFALKTIGVEYLISVAAVGSLRENIKPLDIVVPDQIVDKTFKRVNTFFDENIVVHVGLADPFCPVLSRIIVKKAKQEKVKIHSGGTYLCIEGPHFSTKAESQLYRMWGMDVIGMTLAPEAKLAREAEMCFAAILGVTDYDVWHENEKVSVSLVIENLHKCNRNIVQILKKVIPAIPNKRTCECKDALKNAIVTPIEHIKKMEKNREIIEKLLGKYL